MKRLCNKLIDKNVSLENKLTQLDDIYNHKQLVIETGFKLVKYLMKNNQDELALKLSKRLFVHDLSKIKEDEFYGMAKFADDVDALKDPKKQVESDKQLAINLHWERNSHHPEYWIDLNQMEDLDIMELAADWYARSEQFGTNMLEFLEIRNKDRFHFPQDIYDKIVGYYYIIKEED